MENLKPCPFCGMTSSLCFSYGDDDCEYLEICEKAVLASTEDYERLVTICPYERIICSVNSGGCGASSGYSDSQAVLAENWNKRHEPDAK